MKSRLDHFTFQWLLASSEDDLADISCTTQTLKYSIPPELGEAWAEKLALGEGFNLYRAVHHLEKAKFGELIPMFEVKACEPEFSFNAQIWLSGMGCHQEYWNGAESAPIEITASPGRDTFRFQKDCHARVLIAGGGVSEMRSVYVSESALTALLGDSTATRLLESLGLNRYTKSVVLPMPPHLSHPLKGAMSEQYIGHARRLFAQARVLEYLGGLVNHLFAENQSNSIHKRKIQELREYLVSLEGRLPTLSQLAKDFCLPAKQMNNEFNLEFGQSIYAFVTAHRLEQAHAILKDSNVPMKVISERLGYSHVNHFITAFKRKFAYSPGSLRKKS